MRPARQPRHHFERHLELQHQRAAIVQQRIVDAIGVGQRVGAGDHGDGVAALGVDVDQRDAGRRAGGADPGKVDPGGGEARQRRRTKRVVAGGPGEQHLGPGAPRGERLVGALAARDHGERVAGQGFAGARQAPDARDQVGVDRAEDDDHFTAAVRTG